MGDPRRVRKKSKGPLRLALKRDGPRCWWCGCTILVEEEYRHRQERGEDVSGYRVATLDHLVPVTYAGSEDQKNHVAACRECNIERARKKIVQDRRDAASSNPSVERPDTTRYVQGLPWRLPPEVPKAACYALLTHPTHWKIQLSMVGMKAGKPVLIGKSGIVDFPDAWWCSLDELVDTKSGN